MQLMTDERWQRHANPWSVWTRFAAIPAGMLAIWSRIWLGWWCLLPIGLVVVWLVLNVLVFPPVTRPKRWTSKGIYGEQIWLQNRTAIPQHYAVMHRRLILLGLCGMVMVVWGLVQLHLWMSITGAVVLIIAQLWRIDRFSTLYEWYTDTTDVR